MREEMLGFARRVEKLESMLRAIRLEVGDRLEEAQELAAHIKSWAAMIPDPEDHSTTKESGGE